MVPVMMTREQRAYDSWITREPDYFDPEQPRCNHCGGFLRNKADRVEPWESAIECNGKPEQWTDRYEADRDAGVLNIIGWEHLGHEFHGENPAPCGDYREHAPHKEIMDGGIIEYRVCRHCGHENVNPN